jgi:hypothetical protein
LSFYEGLGVGVLKIEESEVLKIEESESASELLCTDSTALVLTPAVSSPEIKERVEPYLYCPSVPSWQVIV